MVEVGVFIIIVIGLSQVAKELGLKAKYVPLLNLVLGLILSIFFMYDLGLQERILQGIIIGLSASGLFDQSKLFTKEQEKKNDI